jgi:tetratricopeptide (TPR) repeat protein
MTTRFKICLASIWMMTLAVFSLAQTGTVQQWFTEGNNAYAQAHYPAAVEAYSKIIQAGFENEWVFFNLGNAYFKQNRVGMAILCYEKALRISSQSKEIKENLEFARSRIVDKIETPSENIMVHGTKRFFNLLSINQETALVLIFSLCGGIFLLIFLSRILAQWRQIQLALAGIFLLLTLIWGVSNIIRIYQFTHEKGAIILADKADILSGPAAGNPVLFSLHEGTRVEVRQEAGDWSLITLSNGWSGWVTNEKIGSI